MKFLDLAVLIFREHAANPARGVGDVTRVARDEVDVHVHSALHGKKRA